MGYSTGSHNAYFANKRKEEEEKKAQKKKFAFYMMLEEQKARKQFEADMQNVCKTCFMVRNSAGQCPFGCQQ